MNRKIIVPEGMLNAAYEDSIKDADGVVRYAPSIGVRHTEMMGCKRILEFALGWLADNPMAPNDDQVEHLIEIATDANDNKISAREVCLEWQRRMFLDTKLEDPQREKIRQVIVRLFASVDPHKIAKDPVGSYELKQILKEAESLMLASLDEVK